jgi:hypothetical protein
MKLKLKMFTFKSQPGRFPEVDAAVETVGLVVVGFFVADVDVEVVVVFRVDEEGVVEEVTSTRFRASLTARILAADAAVVLSVEAMLFRLFARSAAVVEEVDETDRRGCGVVLVLFTASFFLGSRFSF